MPAPGEQHLNSGGRVITNPFEEKKPRISEYTAQEIATLQCKLAKQLGPEYLSSRAGPGGGKVHYVAAEKCIQLANEVFGFNGWSSQIIDVQVDFVDENPTTLKVSLGLSVVMRVTLKDGTFHEDIGYGHIENCKGKAAAFEKAKKEGTTDGLKRALKNFGNVLGNCIYDKEYLAKVTKLKVQPSKWDAANLHRHSDHAVKKEPEVPKPEEMSQSAGAGASISTEDTMELEDEFEFDEADFGVPDPDAHPDEVVLPAPTIASHHAGSGPRNGSALNGAPPTPNRPPVNRQQHMAPPNGVPGNINGGVPPQPHTPNCGFSRAHTKTGPRRPPQETASSRPYGAPNGAPNGPPTCIVRQVINQDSLNGPPTAPPSAPASPTRQPLPSSDSTTDAGLPPQGAGFFSARAVAREPEGSTKEPLPTHIANLPAFNPYAESPSIKKTPGVDHRTSKPLTRDLKHVPGALQAVTAGPGGHRQNVLNPQMDVTRRIGVPGGMGSPMGNRGGYKPPTFKRSADVGGGAVTTHRTPLVDLPANEAIKMGDGGDIKRQRLNG